jgi:hypothetical protein
MSSDEIETEGIVYISSKRASNISGYTQDYIGQLARNAHINSKRIGGLWYVDMKSLEAYSVQSFEVGSVTEPLIDIKEVNQKESELPVSFDGNEYISANRASKITGYNQDYIGQLARSGKILSRQVGKRWYVNEAALIAHKKEKDALLGAVQAEAVGIRHGGEKEIPVALPPSFQKAELLNYIPEKGDLQPAIEQKVYIEAPIRPISAVSNDFSKQYSPDQNEIPIKVIKKYPVILQRKSLTSTQNRTYDLRKTRKNKEHRLTTGLTILGITASIAVCFVLFITKSTFGNIHIMQLEMTASALDSRASIAFAPIEDFFENLIAPDLVYKR